MLRILFWIALFVLTGPIIAGGVFLLCWILTSITGAE